MYGISACFQGTVQNLDSGLEWTQKWTGNFRDVTITKATNIIFCMSEGFHTYNSVK